MAIKDRVRRKLQAVQMSGKMAALLGAVFQEAWTEPQIVALYQTSDGMLLGMHEGDIGYNDFIGTVSDWRRNVVGIAKVAGLTKLETAWLRAEANV